MCGRFTLTSDPPSWHAEFGIELPADYRPRYNIAPTQPVLAIVAGKEGWRTATLSWGLVPFWARDRKDAAKRINARAESLLEKPIFREAFERHRCLIPVDGFYEWEKVGKQSRPLLIRRRDGRPFTLAGIWARWYEQPDTPLYTCSIITTRPGPSLGSIHDRTPVILEPHDRATWLDRAADPGRLQQLLASGPEDELEWFHVSTLVNSPANDLPECIQPL
jgi:putative SOS response-associated peptidase YedK